MAKEIKELTCIGCPLGCALTVEMDGGEVVKISGNTCPRGAAYAAVSYTHLTLPTKA